MTIGGSRLSLRERGAPSTVELSPAARLGDAIGRSVAMRALFATLARAAATDETILLHGESGTGKEILARAIHDASPRRGGPFVVFDCAASSPGLLEAELFGHVRGAFTGALRDRAGLFEQAGGGTLFIDELGELPVELQPKLLRAIESRRVRRVGANDWRDVDVRLVAATNRELRARVAERAFREDLYYRLAVIEARIPSLRDRKEDIPLLVERFLAAQSPPRRIGDLPPHALELLGAHSWPGNVRELRNVVARLSIFPDLGREVITAPQGRGGGGDDDIGPLLRLPLRDAREAVVERFERRYVAAKLAEASGGVVRAAEAMGVSRQLLHRLMTRYGLSGGG